MINTLAALSELHRGGKSVRQSKRVDRSLGAAAGCQTPPRHPHPPPPPHLKGRVLPPASCARLLCLCTCSRAGRWRFPRGCSISRRSTTCRGKNTRVAVAQHLQLLCGRRIFPFSNRLRMQEGIRKDCKPLFECDEDLVEVLGTSVVD